MPPPEKVAYYKGLKGFTLAEVLITLGIIGVVAAMTMPTLINNTKHKELESALKKAYSTAQQALLLMSEDEGEVNPKYYGVRKFSDAYSKYFNKVLNCGYSSTLPKPCTSTSNYKNYNNTSNVNGAYLDDGQFVLADGMTFFIQNENGDHNMDRSNSLCITIDINGANKRPNKWGHDLFTFQLMNNGQLAPMGQEGTDFYEKECSKTSNSSRNGIGCTYKALTDADYWNTLP